jgi:hypothetical protein
MSWAIGLDQIFVEFVGVVEDQGALAQGFQQTRFAPGPTEEFGPTGLQGLNNPLE